MKLFPSNFPFNNLQNLIMLLSTDSAYVWSSDDNSDGFLFALFAKIKLEMKSSNRLILLLARIPQNNDSLFPNHDFFELLLDQPR